MDTLTTKFKELWQDFVSSFKGNLLTESRKQDISFALVKLALSEAVSTWASEYTINGRWLYKLIQDDPSKGNLVKEILTKDIVLTEEKSNDTKSDSLKYIVPVGAGAIGYGVAHALELATLGTACATLAPMVIAYPITTKYLSNKKEKTQDNLINAYVDQLNKFKESILSALLAQ